MTDHLHPALLPAGLGDLLPPEAETEAGITAALIDGFTAHGYERVKPPLLEYEDSLLGGAGAAMAPETFRLMDPISQRMIGLRADMTLQVARIATTRLVHEPRPLRLCYAGEVLRVRGSQLRPDRQFGQVGAELIGSDAPEADAEIATLATATLGNLGIADLTIDLTLPTLVPAVLDRLAVPDRVAATARQALDRKDAAAIASLGGGAAKILGALMAAAGPAQDCIAALAGLTLPAEGEVVLERLRHVVALIAAAAPDVAVTVDPVENRGFEYHTGISFTLFAGSAKAELGRGGRYRAGVPDADGVRLAVPTEEPATGFSLYTDTVIAAAAPRPSKARIFVPCGTWQDEAARLRAEGWITVTGLDSGVEAAHEAARLKCSHVLIGGQVRALSVP